MNLKSIPIDKLFHLMAGALVASAVYPFGLTAAIIAAFAAAILKEVYDYFFGGTVDVADAFATAFGGAVMVGWLELAGAYR